MSWRFWQKYRLFATNVKLFYMNFGNALKPTSLTQKIEKNYRILQQRFFRNATFLQLMIGFHHELCELNFENALETRWISRKGTSWLGSMVLFSDNWIKKLLDFPMSALLGPFLEMCEIDWRIGVPRKKLATFPNISCLIRFFYVGLIICNNFANFSILTRTYNTPQGKKTQPTEQQKTLVISNALPHENTDAYQHESKSCEIPTQVWALWEKHANSSSPCGAPQEMTTTVYQ